MINIKSLDRQKLAGLFDHTLLKPYASEKDLYKLCEESRTNGFCMVAVNSAPVKLCKAFLAGSAIHVGAAISFPLGQTTIPCKLFEIEQALEDGADEIDYVINLGELKNKNYRYLQDEMQRITDICRESGAIVKAIFENCYLTKEEIKIMCEIANQVRPDYIKTSTGFGTGGAKADDVSLMKSIVGDTIKVKAAGGIRSWIDCKAMLEAGAERIGTSSSLKILQEFETAVYS